MKCKKCGNEVKPEYLIHDEKWVLFGITIYHRFEKYDWKERENEK